MSTAIRWGIPLLLTVAGLVLLIAGGSETTLGIGIVLTGAGPVLALWNLFLPLSLSSSDDRAAEERARQGYQRRDE